jgi:hypothetical protein
MISFLWALAKNSRHWSPEKGQHLIRRIGKREKHRGRWGEPDPARYSQGRKRRPTEDCVEAEVCACSAKKPVYFCVRFGDASVLNRVPKMEDPWREEYRCSLVFSASLIKVGIDFVKNSAISLHCLRWRQSPNAGTNFTVFTVEASAYVS